jgi:hypothetical protein
VCGSSCAGFFCAGSPLKQNSDFLDPRNPDSPYYGDWDGAITRTTTTTRATTATPMGNKIPEVLIGGTYDYSV